MLELLLCVSLFSRDFYYSLDLIVPCVWITQWLEKVCVCNDLLRCLFNLDGKFQFVYGQLSLIYQYSQT